MTQEGAAPLEEQAKERRQRLLRLKRKRDGAGGPPAPQGDHETLPQPIFRSYQPQDARLQENLLSDSRPEDIGQQVSVSWGVPEQWIEVMAAGQGAAGGGRSPHRAGAARCDRARAP